MARRMRSGVFIPGNLGYKSVTCQDLFWGRWSAATGGVCGRKACSGGSGKKINHEAREGMHEDARCGGLRVARPYRSRNGPLNR